MRKLPLLAVAPLAVSLLAGCGSSGPDLGTACNSYMDKSAPDQKSLAQAYLKQVVGDKNPGALATFGAEAALNSYCRAHGDQALKDIRISL